MVIKGRVWKYGDDVNTDLMFPGKYTYSINEPVEMASHALEILDPRFSKEVKPSDIIVAGKNWGCGSSREQAVTCLKECGISAIIAKSFSRIYYRNCINSALPALISYQAAVALKTGDNIEIDLKKGLILHRNDIFEFFPMKDKAFF
jgi:3-isopropylmalate/(R)-2-methylmalate dehydratase small subunit